jgi:putative oxidoreductase
MEVPELKFAIDEQGTAMDVFALWMPRLALVAVFLFIGLTKFNNDPRGEWYRLFERIGLGQWFRLFTGAVQVTGALLLIPRRTLTLGAAVLACTMVGAMLVDIFVVGAAGFALLPLILIGFISAVWYAGRFGVQAAR